MSHELQTVDGVRKTLVITSNTVTQLRQSLKEYLKQDEYLTERAHFHQQQLLEITENRQRVHKMVAATSKILHQMEAEEEMLRCDMAAVKRLSEEILDKIFRYIVQEAYLEKCQNAARWKRSKTRHEPPLVLGRVCSRWRSIVACSPSLWNTVHLFASKITHDDWVPEDRRLRHWLTFGESSDIRLFVYDWTIRRHPFLEELLKYHGSTWRAIHVCVSDGAAGSWSTQSLQAEEVAIYICKGNFTGTHLEPLIDHSVRLTIHGPAPEWGLLPWNRLRSFTLKDYASRGQMTKPRLSFGTAQFTALFGAAPELTELVLDFIPETHTPQSCVVPVVTHKKLRSLSLHLSHFVVNQGPFGVELNAPSLQRLNLLSLAYGATTEITPFNSKWDVPTILSLPPIESSEIIVALDLLKWLPGIRTLEVTGRNVDALFTFMNDPLVRDDVSSDHSHSEDNDISLPKLACICLRDADVCGDTLVRLLRSRMQRSRGGSGCENGSGGGSGDPCAVTRIKKWDTPNVSAGQWSVVMALLEAAASGAQVKKEEI